MEVGSCPVSHFGRRLRLGGELDDQDRFDSKVRHGFFWLHYGWFEVLRGPEYTREVPDPRANCSNCLFFVSSAVESAGRYLVCVWPIEARPSAGDNLCLAVL